MKRSQWYVNWSELGRDTSHLTVAQWYVFWSKTGPGSIHTTVAQMKQTQRYVYLDLHLHLTDHTTVARIIPYAFPMAALRTSVKPHSMTQAALSESTEISPQVDCLFCGANYWLEERLQTSTRSMRAFRCCAASDSCQDNQQNSRSDSATCRSRSPVTSICGSGL